MRTTARGEVGAVTVRGRMMRLGVVDTPGLPPTAGPPSLSGGGPVSEFVTLEAGERVVGLCLARREGAPGLALGTAHGVVKRVTTDHPARADWEVVSLRDGDEVVGAMELPRSDAELVFVTTDAQLLRFDASKVRPQGRSAGGMAGVRLAAGARVVFFGAVPPGSLSDGVAVTIAGSSSALPGTQTGTAKVTPLSEYPGKGRATGGVRCHRFLRGEDELIAAWVGPAPAMASAASGAAIELPPATGRRDGSGTPLPQPVSAISGPLAPG